MVARRLGTLHVTVRTYQDRAVVDGQEQRYRFELRRVDEERRRYVFIHDLRTYSEAALYADVARHMMPDVHFVVWDSRLGRPLYDSRAIAGAR